MSHRNTLEQKAIRRAARAARHAKANTRKIIRGTPISLGGIGLSALSFLKYMRSSRASARIR